MDCIFCKILNGDIPKRSIYEDDICVVIMDAFPATDGHVLIVLKEHIESLDQASDETVAHVAKVAKRISGVIKSTLKPDGLTTVENSGLLQEIPHAHVHLIPTYKDCRGLEFTTKADVENIDAQFKAILARMS